MVSRSVGWWLFFALVMLASAPARAQSSASFPEEPKQPAPAPVAPAPPAPPEAPAPAPTVAPPPPLSSDALRGPPPPPPTLGPAPELRFPVQAARTAPAGPDAPPILPYRDGMPVPAGYTVVDRPATGLVTAGLVGLGISYATAVIIAAGQSFENGTGLLALPVFGPYAAIATREYDCEVDTVAAAKKCTADETQVVTLMAVDGLAQTAGALVAIAGLLSGTQELVRSDLPEVSVTPPVSARSGWQFSVRGDF
jgi:hypothetical protein